MSVKSNHVWDVNLILHLSLLLMQYYFLMYSRCLVRMMMQICMRIPIRKSISHLLKHRTLVREGELFEWTVGVIVSLQMRMRWEMTWSDLIAINWLLYFLSNCKYKTNETQNVKTIDMFPNVVGTVYKFVWINGNKIMQN